MEWSFKARWRYAGAHTAISLRRQILSGGLVALFTYLLLKQVWDSETALQEVVAISVAVSLTEILTPALDWAWNFIRASDKLEIERLSALVSSNVGKAPADNDVDEVIKALEARQLLKRFLADAPELAAGTQIVGVPRSPYLEFGVVEIYQKEATHYQMAAPGWYLTISDQYRLTPLGNRVLARRASQPQ